MENPTTDNTQLKHSRTNKMKQKPLLFRAAKTLEWDILNTDR